MISMIRMYADDILVHTVHKKQYYHHIQKLENGKTVLKCNSIYVYICVCIYMLQSGIAKPPFFFRFADSNTSNARLSSISACETSAIVYYRNFLENNSNA